MIRETLRRIELFKSLNDDELLQLANNFLEIGLVEDQFIFEEGQPANAFFIVRKGSVNLFRNTVGRPVHLLARLGPDDFFGELGLFDTIEHSMSARAAELSTILRIYKEDFVGFLEERPAIALKLQMAAAKRHSTYAAAALELGLRNEVRIRVDRDAVLTLEDTSACQTTVDNLSPGGLSLHGIPGTWNLEAEVSFRLAIRGATPLDLSGKVVWQRGDRVGIAFTDSTLEHELRIQNVLRQLLDPGRAPA